MTIHEGIPGCPTSCYRIRTMIRYLRPGATTEDTPADAHYRL